MINPIGRTPFLFLLIPLIVGIVIQYYLQIYTYSILFLSLGVIVMLYSYLLPSQIEYRMRWIFGFGLILFVVGMGLVSTAYRQHLSDFSYLGKSKMYRAQIIDVPQVKEHSLSYKAYLPNEKKHVICYVQYDTLHEIYPTLGDEILFDGEIKPFRNIRYNERFDYIKYMHDKGFVGSTFIRVGYWRKVGEHFSLSTEALKLRAKILLFYNSLGFSDEQVAVLSALTLGYQYSMSDDMKQAFRTTGTVHVLSVSGLHVGIIYAIIAFLLSFIYRTSRFYRFKPILIIALLWLYAFVTGLSPSVVRASAMLTVFCVSEIFDKKSYSVNALYITAFLMLLINPYLLFDIGFQLSFASVFGILYLYPLNKKVLKIKNKYLRGAWQLFFLSIVAQLATFPLCLYYFGTFPTYFFIANMVIVPLVTLVTYSVLLVCAVSVISNWMTGFFYFVVEILKFLVTALTSFVFLFERLPYALAENFYISVIDVILIYTILFTLSLYFLYKKRDQLLHCVCITILILVGIQLL